MRRREFLQAGTALVTTSLFASAKSGPRIEIWNGLHHRVGHLGDTQDDFNVLGHVDSQRPISNLAYRVNGSLPQPLDFKVFRRIVRYGDFNADIPVASLHAGENHVVIEATDIEGRNTRTDVTVTRMLAGACNLPMRINWGKVGNLEDVGQFIDGRWLVGPTGLRTAEMGYDRIFLIGNRSWKDYEVTAPITVYGFSPRNGSQSGIGHCVGFALRWSGHSTEDNAQGDQPKWGLHPRGGVTWLVWRTQEGLQPPVRNFLRGDSEDDRDFSPFPVQVGRPFWMKGRCETLAANGATRYSFKTWNTQEPEPASWDFQVVQESASALRTGGIAFVAHETDAALGDFVIEQR